MSVASFLFPQRNLKISNTKQTHSPCRDERSPHTTDLALRKTHLPHASVSDPSLLEGISRSLWRKTGENKLMSPARLKWNKVTTYSLKERGKVEFAVYLCDSIWKKEIFTSQSRSELAFLLLYSWSYFGSGKGWPKEITHRISSALIPKNFSVAQLLSQI